MGSDGVMEHLLSKRAMATISPVHGISSSFMEEQGWLLGDTSTASNLKKKESERPAPL